MFWGYLISCIIESDVGSYEFGKTIQEIEAGQANSSLHNSKAPSTEPEFPKGRMNPNLPVSFQPFVVPYLASPGLLWKLFTNALLITLGLEFLMVLGLWMRIKGSKNLHICFEQSAHFTRDFTIQI